MKHIIHKIINLEEDWCTPVLSNIFILIILGIFLLLATIIDGHFPRIFGL